MMLVRAACLIPGLALLLAAGYFVVSPTGRPSPCLLVSPIEVELSGQPVGEAADLVFVIANPSMEPRRVIGLEEG